MALGIDESWSERLLQVGMTLMSDLDESVVLDRVLQTARELTGARYAALGVLNEDRTELARFLTSGLDEGTHQAIGDLPRGRGVLGVLIEHPEPLRLSDVGDSPSSYGFPAGHPTMRGFLGVPILIRGEAWGNLYLTEKQAGQFTEADEQAATILAQWAAIAIENARLYEVSQSRLEELEKAMRGLEATRDVAVAIGGEIGLEHVLELIVKRGRALIDARSLVIMLRDGESLEVHSSAGHAATVEDIRLPIAGSTSGQVLERGFPERITDVPSRLRIAPREFGVPDAQTAMLVPMVYRGAGLGILAAFDHGEDRGAFSEEDEHMLQAFAASAATAVALAQSVQTDRLRVSLAAADAERRRWARELHDETLQGLGGLRLLLSSAVRSADPARSQEAMREAIGYIEQEIENLRAIITELRPAALDELGLATAIEALLDRHREQSGLIVDATIELGVRGEDRGLDIELETAAYRLVQEALTNVAKHANANSVRVSVKREAGRISIEVADDGRGFDTAHSTDGFGLAGMRERVTLAGGTLSIESGENGTTLSATLSELAPAKAQTDSRPRASA
jgi:signal transduction histidine kinase